jgi:hypothetical protein
MNERGNHAALLRLRLFISDFDSSAATSNLVNQIARAYSGSLHQYSLPTSQLFASHQAREGMRKAMTRERVVDPASQHPRYQASSTSRSNEEVGAT